MADSESEVMACWLDSRIDAEPDSRYSERNMSYL